MAKLFYLIIFSSLVLSCHSPKKKNNVKSLEKGEKKEVEGNNNGLVMVGVGESENSSYYLEAANLMASGEYDSAIKIYKDLCNREKKSHKTHAFLGLGSAYLASSKYDAALESYKSSIRLEPSNIEAVISIGSVYYSQQRFDSAITYYQKGLLLDVNNSNCYWGLAISYDMLGNKALARKNAETFVRLAPESQYRSMLEDIINK